MLNGKDKIICLIVGSMKNIWHKWVDVFQNRNIGTNVKAELDLSNYATKADFKNAIGVDTSDFAKNTDLANLKSDIYKLDTDKLKSLPTGLCSLKIKVDKLDIPKLEATPVDLSKLSNVVKTDVVKKTEYNECQ